MRLPQLHTYIKALISTLNMLICCIVNHFYDTLKYWCRLTEGKQFACHLCYVRVDYNDDQSEPHCSCLAKMILFYLTDL